MSKQKCQNKTFEIHKGFTNSNNIFKFSQFTNPNEAKSIKKMQ